MEIQTLKDSRDAELRKTRTSLEQTMSKEIQALHETYAKKISVITATGDEQLVSTRK